MIVIEQAPFTKQVYIFDTMIHDLSYACEVYSTSSQCTEFIMYVYTTLQGCIASWNTSSI